MEPPRGKNLDSLEALFLDHLHGLVDAERQQLAILPRLAATASSSSLQTAFRQHVQETQNQVARLERALQALGRTVEGRPSHAMKGLLADAGEALDASGDPAVRDAALIAAAQNIEHYEISAYGTARAFARYLGREDVAQLLQETLFEETALDRWLTLLAEGSINARATTT